MTRIFIQQEKQPHFSAANDIILKIHKNVNEKNDTVHYYVKLFNNEKAGRDFTFEYVDGDLKVTRGKLSQKEKDLLVRCIQIAELSDFFP